MKQRFFLSTAALGIALTSVLDAAPIFTLPYSTSVQAYSANGSQTFEEPNPVSFNRTATSFSSDEFGSSLATSRLQVTFDGWHVSGQVQSSGTPAGTGAFTVQGYRSSFDLLIDIPMGDDPYPFTLTSNVAASFWAEAVVQMQGTDSLYVRYDTYADSFPAGGTSSGLFLPGHQYHFTVSEGSRINAIGQYEPKSSSHSFDLAIVPEPSALTFLGVAAFGLCAGRRRLRPVPMP